MTTDNLMPHRSGLPGAGKPRNVLTIEESCALQKFRGTGRYVGRDARLRDRSPKSSIRHEVLMSLSRKGLLEHFIANRWFLTDAGRDVVYGRVEAEIDHIYDRQLAEDMRNRALIILADPASTRRDVEWAQAAVEVFPAEGADATSAAATQE